MKITKINMDDTNHSFMELETIIKSADFTKISMSEFIDMYKDNLNIEDIIYLVDAYLMPKNEIEEALTIYRNNKPKMDELKFVEDLSKKYGVDIDTIIRRIQEVIVVKGQNSTKIRKKVKEN